MVDQKQPPQVEAVNDNLPQDPNRRKLIKVIALGGAGLAAFGSAFLFNRDSSEQNELTPSTAVGPNQETSPSSLPSTSTLETVTTTSLAQEISDSISRETLPLSIDEPEVWVRNLYSNLDILYNSRNPQLMDYIFSQGSKNVAADYVEQRLEALDKQGGLANDVQITGKLIEVSRLNPEGSSKIQVEETFYAPSILDARRYPTGEEKHLLNYIVHPYETTYIEGNNSEPLTLYLILGIQVVCRYDKDGNCR